MRLKVNTRILFILILLSTLVMTSCHPRHEGGGEPGEGGTPNDTFFNRSVHTFLVIPTITAIIIDGTGKQINQSGILVSDNFGLGSVLRDTTNSSGAVSFHIVNPSFPMTFSATDHQGHTFTPVKVESAPIPNPIKIVEVGTDSIVTKPATK